MNLREVLLGIGIIILTIFVTIYGISVLYPKQEYNHFCEEDNTYGLIETPQECEEAMGKWTAQERFNEIETVKGFCDTDFSCRQDYEDAQEKRAKKIFFIAIPLGIILVLVGSFLFGIEAIGAGLMGGGIGTIIYGAGGYWAYGGELFRFVISLLGLLIIIYLTYWLNKKFRKKK